MTVTDPYIDSRAKAQRVMKPWTVSVRSGSSVAVHRFETEEEAAAFARRARRATRRPARRAT